uniref:Uncharacterized protein n=1 Tax=Glossina brevipalpis TaxID=37001 RepID=A0A1A9W3R5_9MUSC
MRIYFSQSVLVSFSCVLTVFVVVVVVKVAIDTRQRDESFSLLVQVIVNVSPKFVNVRFINRMEKKKLTESTEAYVNYTAKPRVVLPPNYVKAEATGAPYGRMDFLYTGSEDSTFLS